MPLRDGRSLWDAVRAAGALAERALWGAEASVRLGELVGGSSLGGRLEELRGRSVLVATRDQLTAAVALLDPDGGAGRLVLGPSHLRGRVAPFVRATGGVDAVVSDRAALEAGSGGTVVPCSARLAPADSARTGPHHTEWILLTSGTTGVPKLVVHTLASLAGAINGGRVQTVPAVWSTLYGIRRDGGLPILLRALLGRGWLVLAG